MKQFCLILLGLILIACSDDAPKRIDVKEKQKEKLVIKPSDVELGDYSFIEIGVKNSYQSSRRFYEILGFSEIPNQFTDTNMVMFSDSNLILVLNKASIAPAMLIYLNENVEKLSEEIKAEGLLVRGFDNGIEIKSPDGVKVTVLNQSSKGLYRPTSKKMMELMQSNDIADPSKLPNKKIGVFGEFSHQTKDINRALLFWAKLGIIGSGIMEYGYKYSIILDRYSVIGVHEQQDDKWLGSAITYFATDQEVRLAKLKQELPPESINESSKLGAGSAIIKSPEGNLVFVFKL